MRIWMMDVDIDLEALRTCLYAPQGVKAVEDDLRLFRTNEGALGVSVTILVASPDVDPGPVVRTLEIVLRERFDISVVQVAFKGIEQSRREPDNAARGPLEKM